MQTITNIPLTKPEKTFCTLLLVCGVLSKHIVYLPPWRQRYICQAALWSQVAGWRGAWANFQVLCRQLPRREILRSLAITKARIGRSPNPRGLQPRVGWP
jgi:hypothetical protein